MQEVVKAYKDKGDVKAVQSTGLHIGGERFIVIKADDRSIYGKKVRLPVLAYPLDHEQCGSVRAWRWHEEVLMGVCCYRARKVSFW